MIIRHLGSRIRQPSQSLERTGDSAATVRGQLRWWLFAIALRNQFAAAQLATVRLPRISDEWGALMRIAEDDLIAGIVAFEENERRDAMYKVATFLVRHFWGKPSDMADGLGVLLLTWNQAFYRYGGFDFELLENCISGNFESLVAFRRRDLLSYSPADDADVKRLFSDFLEALRIRKNGDIGPKSPVAVSKALHLLAPGFFALWDVEIAKAYGCAYSNSPAEKYIRFMRKQRDILHRINNNLVSTSSDKTMLKLLDEYNYSKFTKHWI